MPEVSGTSSCFTSLRLFGAPNHHRYESVEARNLADTDTHKTFSVQLNDRTQISTRSASYPKRYISGMNGYGGQREIYGKPGIRYSKKNNRLVVNAPALQKYLTTIEQGLDEAYRRLGGLLFESAHDQHRPPLTAVLNQQQLSKVAQLRQRAIDLIHMDEAQNRRSAEAQSQHASVIGYPVTSTRAHHSYNNSGAQEMWNSQQQQQIVIFSA